MKKARYDKASRGYTFIKALGITLLAFFILVNIAGAVSIADISNSSSNNASNLNKSNEAIKAYDKASNSDEALKALDNAIEINPHDSNVWIYKGNVLSDLNKLD
jgi:tetratricopeptide (TPR) repeat protein